MSVEKAAGTALAARPRSRFNVPTRLLGAILVPIMVLFAGAVQVVRDRHSDLQRTEGVLRRVDTLVLLTELRSSLFAERLAAEILVPARNPTEELLATTRFGMTLLTDPQSLRDRTDRAITALDLVDRPFPQGDLDLARSDPELWSGTISGIQSRLGPLYDGTVVAMLELAAPVRASIVTIADDDLLEAGTTFERTIALPGAAAEVLSSLTDLYLAEAFRRPSLQSATAAAAASFDDHAARFVQALTRPESQVSRSWLSSQQPPADIRQALAVAAQGDLTSAARAPLEPPTLGRTLLDGLDWLVSVDQIPALAAADVREAAERVVDDARDTERTVALAAVAVVAASLVVLLALAHSIGAPVRRLTDRARQVGAGNLDVEPLALTGPPDVAAANAAINEVVEIFTLIRRKASALAEGRFADPSLSVPLRGSLGAELERSATAVTTTLIERERLQTQLVYDATHDALTGLANRKSLLAAMSRPMAAEDGVVRAVIFIDLNNFKRVNDLYGHAAGDRVLQVVADRLIATTPPAGLVARWGGDEFVVALPAASAADALVNATNLMETVSRPIDLEGSVVRVAACAGVATTSEVTSGSRNGDDPAEADLLRRADFAVYEAKSSGAGTVVLFDEQLGRKIRHRDEIEVALAAALERSPCNELLLRFQPIVHAGTGRLRGMEALVRWNHPDLGMLPPDEFIPIAERSDLIVRLDRWVLESALRQLRAWSREACLVNTILSVNVSARSLRDVHFLPHVVTALVDANVPADRLMLEITETALITDVGLASAQLLQLRRAGVRIAIDDFGTGFTSVSQLRHMPVDELKIDRSFIDGVHIGDNLVLVRMINDLAHHLNIETIAEGVETSTQREILVEIGCDALQGYHFAQPLGPVEFLREAASRF